MREAREARTALAHLERDDVLEQVDRELRQEHRQRRAVAPLPRSAPEEAGERLARVPERDVRREGREEPVHGPPAAQQHDSAIASASTRAEESRSGAEVLHRASGYQARWPRVAASVRA